MTALRTLLLGLAVTALVACPGEAVPPADAGCVGSACNPDGGGDGGCVGAACAAPDGGADAGPDDAGVDSGVDGGNPECQGGSCGCPVNSICDAGPPFSDGGCSVDRWCATNTGLIGLAVSGTSASDVWVVGTPAGTSGGAPPVAMHWDGGAWAGVYVPTSSLGAVSLSAPTVGWATGAAGAFARVDGGSLELVTRPTTASCTGVWTGAADLAWAACADGSLLRWNGSSWAAVDAGTAALRGVAAIAPGVLFAVGSGGTALQSVDGGAWLATTTSTTASLRRVWGTSSSNAWAVGSGGAVLHWDGLAWTATDAGTSRDLTDVWGSAADDVWITGAAGTLLHFDGGSWAPVASGTPRDLWGVWGASSADVWVVGHGGLLRLTP